MRERGGVCEVCGRVLDQVHGEMRESVWGSSVCVEGNFLKWLTEMARIFSILRHFLHLAPFCSPVLKPYLKKNRREDSDYQMQEKQNEEISYFHPQTYP